jgi:hypothetical protein
MQPEKVAEVAGAAQMLGLTAKGMSRSAKA